MSPHIKSHALPKPAPPLGFSYARDTRGQSSSDVVSSLPEAIGGLLTDQIVLPGGAPGATAAIARRVDGVWLWASGCAGWTDPFDGDVVTVDTWYDLASLTKSITALAVARAVDGGLMTWDAPLAQYLPFLEGTFGGRASILSLLSHRAGFIAHTLLPNSSQGALTALAQAQRADLGAASSTVLEPHDALYSDVGYILAGLALERCRQRALDICLEAELAAMAAQSGIGLEPPGWPDELASARQLVARGVAASEVAPTEVVATRGGLIRAHVHDDNAWTLSETSTSGHAGMFGTARGVLGVGTLLLDLVAGRSDALSRSSWTTLLAPRPSGSLRAGFDAKESQGSSVAGTVLGHRTFGHLGFTGTSYWCDPEAEIVVVLLTNRVCPSRGNGQLRALRPVVHDGLARLALALGTR